MFPISTTVVVWLLMAAVFTQHVSAVADARKILMQAALAEANAMTDRHRALLASPTSTAVNITTPFGSLTGVSDGQVTQFLGVPFAAPPIGALRWAPPVPPTPWGARNATWWGKACPQNKNNRIDLGLFAGMGEDCLMLNVYYPSNKTCACGWVASHGVVLWRWFRLRLRLNSAGVRWSSPAARRTM